MASPEARGRGKRLLFGLDTKTFLETWSQFHLNVDDSRSYRLPYNEGSLTAFFPGTDEGKSDQGICDFREQVYSMAALEAESGHACAWALRHLWSVIRLFG